MSFGCVICSEIFDSLTPPNDENSTVALKKCGHAFHNSCIRTWLVRPGTSSCPICRCPATTASITQLLFPSVNVNLDDSGGDVNVKKAIKESLKEAKKMELNELKFKLATLQSHYGELKEVFDDFQEGLKKLESVIEKNAGLTVNTPPPPPPPPTEIFDDSFANNYLINLHEVSLIPSHYGPREIPSHVPRDASQHPAYRGVRRPTVKTESRLNENIEGTSTGGSGRPSIANPRKLLLRMNSHGNQAIGQPTRASTLRRQASLARVEATTTAASANSIARQAFRTNYALRTGNAPPKN